MHEWEARPARAHLRSRASLLAVRLPAAPTRTLMVARLRGKAVDVKACGKLAPTPKRVHCESAGCACTLTRRFFDVGEESRWGAARASRRMRRFGDSARRLAALVEFHPACRRRTPRRRLRKRDW